MRSVIVALAFLALPAMAAAQQADQPTELRAPQVEMQQSTPSGPAAVDVVETERVDLDRVEVRSSTTADDAAIQGDPTQRQWWWLVGAIVVAAILISVIL